MSTFHRFVCLLLIIWGSCFSSVVLATPSVTLTDKNLHVVEDNALWHLLPEPLKNPSYRSLSDVFDRAHPPKDSLLGQHGPAVARLRLVSDDRNTHWFAVLNANFIDTGTAYWQPDHGSPVRLQAFSQPADQSTPHLFHYQAIRLPAGALKGTLLLYVDAQQYAYPFSIKLMNEGTFYRYQFGINSISMIAIAIMLTLGLIALLLYLRTRYSITLACAGYIGLHGIGWAAAAGMINDAQPRISYNSAYWGILIFPFAIACACQFTRLLFGCSRKHPRIAYYLNGLTLCCVVLGCIMLWLPFWQAFALSHLIATIWLVTALVISLSLLKSEGYIARYYFIGNLIYAGSLVFFMLSHTYTIDTDISPELVVLGALSVDCLCILLSLTEWINQRKQEYSRSYHYARIDPLTEVGNRYAFQERQRTLKQHSLLVFIDIDGMKAVNDKRGHDQGDRLLRDTTTLMRKVMAGQGEVFRTGGDEFIWLYDADQPLQIKRIADSLSTQVACIEQQLKLCGWHEVGISYGFASSDETRSISQSMALADQRMYNHKQSKRHTRHTVPQHTQKNRTLQHVE